MLGKAVLVLFVAALAFPGPASVAPDSSNVHLAEVGDVEGALDLVDFPAGTISDGAEPMILVDRVHGALLVGDTSGVHRSTNNGASWTHPSLGFLPGAFTDGRALAQDDAGTLYAATTQGQLISVARSTNGGQTWTIASHLAAAASIADRPWLAAGPAGTVALVYFGDASEMCAVSTDGGQTWLTTSVLETPNAGNLVMDEQGRAWYSDGSGVTYYAKPCGLTPQHIPLPSSGAQIFTQIALDRTKTAPDQFVAQPSTDNARMLLRGHSGLAGATWKDVSVSPGTLKSNTFGAIAIKDDASEIAVAWYGSTTPGNPSVGSFPTTATWNVYVSRVTNFWSATPTITTTLVASGNHVGQFCMDGVSCTTQDRDLLDYMGVTYAPDGKLHVAYGHDGSGSSASVRHASFT